MGKVVQLDVPARKAKGGRGQRAGREKRSKTALVLGGGGFTGAVYEIGALRAFDLLAVNRNVNDFDVYVGSSAGSFVASLVSNGVTPEEMMRVLNKDLPSPIPDPALGRLMRLNIRGLIGRTAVLPFKVAGLAREISSHWREMTPMDVVLGLGELLPAGLYTQHGLADYIEEVLSDPDRTNDFTSLGCELYLTATDVDTCERIIFGEGEWDDVPISTAVSASSALPMVYAPVELKGRQLMDGAIRSTTNVDIAVERGAKFIVVVNPIVPYVNDFQAKMPTVFGSRPRRVADMGFPFVGYQAFKLMAHARLHQMVQYWEERYPGVDFILIEPEPNDELMFGTSIMNYSARLEIARHGFESVTVALAKDYERYREVCARHGLEISARRVNAVLKQVEEAREEHSAWRRVLEQTTGTLLRNDSRA